MPDKAEFEVSWVIFRCRSITDLVFKIQKMQLEFIMSSIICKGGMLNTLSTKAHIEQVFQH